MARVKGAMMTRKRRNKTLKLAKGYWGSKSKHFKMAQQAVFKSLTYAYTCLLYTSAPIESLAAAVALNHHHGQAFHSFIGGEALAAGETLPAPADTVALFGGAGIYDLAFFKATIGTFHSLPPFLPNRQNYFVLLFYCTSSFSPAK